MASTDADSGQTAGGAAVYPAWASRLWNNAISDAIHASMTVMRRSARTSGEAMVAGVRAYAEDVRSRAFPDKRHSYGIAPEELDRLRSAVHGHPRSVV